MSEPIDFSARYEQLVGICRGLVWARRAAEPHKAAAFDKAIEDKLVEWEEVDEVKR